MHVYPSFIALALLAGSSFACSTKAQTSEHPNVASSDGGTGPVVDVEWLQGALAAGADVQVIDIRPLEDFSAGHVPGSLSLDLEQLRATRDGVPSQVATPEQIEAALQDAGLRVDSRVVVLDKEVSPAPARVVWTLHYSGHAEAHLLQGGWTAWEQSGAEIETGPPSAPPGDFAVEGPVDELRVDADWVLEHLDDPTVTLVDARSPEEYAAGHIPGAILIPWQDAVTSAGALRDLDELEKLFEAVPRDDTVVAYCSSGARSSLNWLILVALGYPDARVYDGSWNEWGAREDLPQAP